MKGSIFLEDVNEQIKIKKIESVKRWVLHLKKTIDKNMQMIQNCTEELDYCEKRIKEIETCDDIYALNFDENYSFTVKSYDTRGEIK